MPLDSVSAAVTQIVMYRIFSDLRQHHPATRTFVAGRRFHKSRSTINTHQFEGTRRPN